MVAWMMGLLILMIFFITTGSVYAHPGGLDSYGCHHNRKQGGYHCHRGQLAGESFQSREEMMKRLKGAGEINQPTQKKYK